MPRPKQRIDHFHFGLFRDLIKSRLLPGVRSPGHAVKLALGGELNGRGFGGNNANRAECWRAFFDRFRQNFHPKLDYRFCNPDQPDRYVVTVIDTYWTSAKKTECADEAYLIYFWLHLTEGYQLIANAVDRDVIGAPFHLAFDANFPSNTAEAEALYRRTQSEEGRSVSVAVSASDEQPKLSASFPRHIVFESTYQSGRREFSDVKSYLLSGEARSAALTAAVHGAGGYGKTSIAEELCLDEEVRARFPGGIYWLQFSMHDHADAAPHPNQIFRPADVAIGEMLRNQGYDRSLTEPLQIDSIARLLEILPDDDLLVVADDLWNADQALWIGELRTNASALVTTRNRSLATSIGQPFLIDRLSKEASYNLLSHSMRDVTPQQKVRLQKLSIEFGGWALLLKIANGRFRKFQGIQNGIDLALKEFEAFLLGDDITGWDAVGTDADSAIEKRRRLVGYCIEAGLDALLDPLEKALLVSLGVFADDADIPYSVASDYWAELTKSISSVQPISDIKSRTLLQAFDELSFFSKFDIQREVFRMHDEVLAYLRGRPTHHKELGPKDQETRHRCLTMSLRAHCSGGWHTLNRNHRYGWVFLLHHLEAQGLKDDADTLRTNYNWLKAKLDAVGVSELKDTFRQDRQSPDDAVSVVGRAITVAEPVLSRRPQAFAHQIYGRLGHQNFGPIAHIIEAAERDADFRPKVLEPHLDAIGSERKRFTGHRAAVVSAAFAPDGSQILTASSDKTARIWNAESGKEVFVLAGHNGEITQADCCQQGLRVGTASKDHTARIWSSETGTLLQILEGHQSWVNNVGFSPDGRRLITSSWDYSSRLYDGENYRLIKILEGHGHAVNHATFSRDNRFISTSSHDKSAIVWFSNDGERYTSLIGHSDSVLYSSFSPDSKLLITTSQDNTAILWDINSKKIIHVLSGHLDSVFNASFSADGRRIVTVSRDKTARVWDVETGDIVSEFTGHNQMVVTAVWSNDGLQVLTGSSDKTARVWEANSGEEIEVIEGHQEGLTSAVFSPNGRHVLTASYDKSARITDRTSLFKRQTNKAAGVLVAVAAFSPDGAQIFVADKTGRAQLRDVKTLEILREFSSRRERTYFGAFSSDGSKIATATVGHVWIWDTRTARKITRLRGHKQGLWSVEFSPDACSVVTTSSDKTANIWDSRSGEVLARLAAHDQRVCHASFSSCGGKVVTSSDDKTACVWDVETGAHLVELRGHSQGVTCAKFSKDGHIVATVSHDKTARLWDAQTGDLLRIFEGHDGTVTDVVFSENGGGVFTASDDRTVRFWSQSSSNLDWILDLDSSCVSLFERSKRIMMALNNGDVTIALNE